MDYLSPGTMVAFVSGDNFYQMLERSIQLLKQISLIEIVSTVVLLAIVVVDLSGVFHCMLLTKLHFKLPTGAHLLLMEC